MDFKAAKELGFLASRIERQEEAISMLEKDGGFHYVTRVDVRTRKGDIQFCMELSFADGVDLLRTEAKKLRAEFEAAVCERRK